MNKISLQELQKIFGEYHAGKYRPLVATKSGFAHVVNPTYKPPKSDMTPKKYEDQQKSFKIMNEAKKKKKPFLYQCPDCFKPMGKLGYCEAHKKWAQLIPVKEK